MLTDELPRPDVHIIDARTEHAPFLAWVMRTASRSHLDRGGLEMFVDGPDDECLRFLEPLLFTEARHWGNIENFLVAESTGRPLGALAGYFVEETDGHILGKPAVEVARQQGWTDDRLLASWKRIISGTYVAIERVPGAWIIEGVAVVPDARGTGLVGAMIDAILDRGRQRGATCAEVSVFIGNDSAQRAYEKAGFAVVGEARHPEYEAVFGCPGVRLLRRSL